MARIDTFGMEFPGVAPEISESALYPFIIHLGRIEAEQMFGLPRARRLQDKDSNDILEWTTGILQKVKSPIEAAMAVELCFISVHPILMKICTQYDIWPVVYFQPQVKSGSYTVDFMVTAKYAGATHNLAVECDGHDYHERTKEQAAHDRRRDRALLTSGCPTLRFTGSEIWRDPVGCGDQIANYLAALVTEIAKKRAKK